jgi:hypothetical protein
MVVCMVVWLYDGVCMVVWLMESERVAGWCIYGDWCMNV